jgi:hypothetical protein
MLAKGLGGSNMLHIILALSNSREQVHPLMASDGL